MRTFNKPAEYNRVVRETVKRLKGVQFDTIVFRGFSGAIIGGMIAQQLGKPWALVRKPGDSSHSRNSIEGTVYGTYVIIDDFVDSGETIRTIVKACELGTCVGVFFYDLAWAKTFNDPDAIDLIRARVDIKLLNWE